MTRLLISASLLAMIALPAFAQSASTASGTVKDAIGTWQTRYIPQAGVSVDTPCKPELSYSDPQDGYRHAIDEVELRCHIGPIWPPGVSFRIDVSTYKADPSVIHSQFKRYMDLIQSIEAGTDTGARVTIARQRHETHQNFTLTQKAVHGDLGYHETENECFWNFYGLAGDAIVQAIMTVPKEMCPSANEPSLTEAAARFYNSLRIDGVN